MLTCSGYKPSYTPQDHQPKGVTTQDGLHVSTFIPNLENVLAYRQILWRHSFKGESLLLNNSGLYQVGM